MLSVKCALCEQRETLHHALNHCQKGVTQERYNLRQDSVLLHICRKIMDSKSRNGKRFDADRQEHSFLELEFI